MKKRSLRTRIRDNAICLYAFLIPFLIMLGIFILRNIYPFGDGSFMHSDMYHQYVPFLNEFTSKLREGDSLFYSWNVGIGSNFLALYVYYMASPFNWLMLLVPQQFLIEFMSYMVVFKIGLCGFTFAWYLTRHFQTRRFAVLFFSTFYAMSGFLAAYNWNVMWIDCIVLAPLILLGLEALVREGKCRLYCIALALSILTNYYISIMICIFLVLYFLVLWIDAPEKGRALFRFALYSLLAGGMAAVLLLPELAALYFTEFSDFNFPSKLKFYFSFYDMVARHCMDVQVETGLDHWPNIYCGSAVFFLIPLYLMNRRIPAREKITRLLLCAFLLLSFATNMLTFIWHGMNYPDSLPSRQSFLYIFLILTLCFEALHRMEGVCVKDLLLSLGCALAFLMLGEKIVTDDAFWSGSFYLTGIFLLLYALFYYLYQNRTGYKKLLCALTLILVIVESATNMMATSVSTTSRSKYLENHDAYQALVARTRANDPDFYRFEKFSRVTKNDGTMLGYPTASLFSSTANANVENRYDRLGMSESKVFYCFDGATPFTSALLNVRYLFSKTPNEDPALYELIDQEGEIYLYRCRYTLPAGFVLEESWDLESLSLFSAYENPLEMQNAMVQSLGVDGLLFDPLTVTENGNTVSFQAQKSGHYYAYTNQAKVSSVSLTSASRSKTFKKLNYDYIMDLGYHEAGEQITLSCDSVNNFQLSAFYLEESVLSQALSVIGSRPFTVDSFSSTRLSGHIAMEEAGTLVLPVAYEPGWKVTVDGREVTPSLFDECMIQVELEAGEHTVSLSFVPAGLIPGAVISLFCLACFCFLQSRTGTRTVQRLQKTLSRSV